ncbi:hypothetical protein EK21DRAFT_76197, partial [Setomelanomma holmii]
MSAGQDSHPYSGPDPKPEPTLNTLPSELRRLIVSHLAPDPDHLHPGCKRHLQSANLAHSCLREWVREYLFQDMALNHVLVGMSSHLECFLACISQIPNMQVTRLLLTIQGIAGTHGNCDWHGDTGSAGTAR